MILGFRQPTLAEQEKIDNVDEAVFVQVSHIRQGVSDSWRGIMTTDIRSPYVNGRTSGAERGAPCPIARRQLGDLVQIVVSS